MKVTECLNTEHGVFLGQLRVLEKMLREKATDDELRAVTLAVAEAVEKHRDAEETILYPAIVRAYGEGFPPIAVMESEHREIEAHIRAIDARSGNVAERVRSFVDLLKNHIEKEIRVLFPMAEERIPKEELEHMACRCVESYHSSSRADGGHPCCGHA